MQSSSKIIALVMGANKSKQKRGILKDRDWCAGRSGLSLAPCSAAGQRKGASS